MMVWALTLGNMFETRAPDKEDLMNTFAEVVHHDIINVWRNRNDFMGECVINASCAEFYSRNIIMYNQFLSYLHTYMTHVV